MTTRRWMGRIVAGFGMAILAAAQQAPPQGPPPTAGKTAEQAYKNIKVLKGSAADELGQTMHLISGELGVDCEYCHLEKDRVTDEIKAKNTAREMIKMTNELNKKSFNGQQVVTCYTCHRGSAIPLNVPLLPMTESPAAEKAPEKAATAPLPSADQILAKYIEALGGEQALRKVSSRLITGTQDIPTGPGGVKPVPAHIERYQKAPNLLLNVYKTTNFTTSDGFDGTVYWTQDPRGRVAQPVKMEQIRAKRNANIFESVDLKREYTQLKVDGIEKVNNHDAYVVIGYPAEKIPERLYFDTQSGLLLRKTTNVPTPVGNSPFQVDYDDYQATSSGVKFPFVIHMEPAGSRTEMATHSTIHVEKVEDNVAIDDAKFVKPQSKEAPPPPPVKTSSR